MTTPKIPTITTDVYPTRYAALAHPGRWAIFEPVAGLYRSCTEDAPARPVADLGAYTRGGEMAVLHLPVKNPNYPAITDGTYVEVINLGDGNFVAQCNHYEPTREREQVNARLAAASREEAMVAAEKWIAGLGCKDLPALGWTWDAAAARFVATRDPSAEEMLGWISRYAEAIVGKLAAEGAVDMGDAELDRCLGECVGGRKLLEIARAMRDLGLVYTADMADMAWDDVKARLRLKE